MREDILEFRPAGEGHDAPVKFAGGSKALCIPGADFSEHPAAMHLPKKLDHQVQVPLHDPGAFFKFRLRLELAGAQKMGRVRKNPRIIKRAPPDAYPRAAGLL